MKIGIDISQVAYQNTGVSNYLTNLIYHVLSVDQKNEYILFFSSLRRTVPIEFRQKIENIGGNRVIIKKFIIPLSILNVLWNKIHKLPIERFIGPVDIFISSDWVEPPTSNALKATILYDLSVYKYPEESAYKIVKTQKRKLRWVREETDVIFCISKATLSDAVSILRLDPKKLHVLYPGL